MNPVRRAEKQEAQRGAFRGGASWRVLEHRALAQVEGSGARFAPVSPVAQARREGWWSESYAEKRHARRRASALRRMGHATRIETVDYNGAPAYVLNVGRNPEGGSK